MFNSTNKKMLTKALLFLIVILSFSSSFIYSQITPIDSLKVNGPTGIPLMVGDTINTTGIVTSLKQLGTGTSGPGSIQNGNTAISVYGTVFTQATGIQIGDSVVINNFKVTNYNGLNELSSIASSTVQIISSGHVVNPTIITIPQISQGWNGFEKYEGMLVQLNNVAFSDTGSGYDTFNLHTSTSGWNYHVANGTDTVIFRLTKTNTSLIGKSVPTGPISVVGIVQQYVSTSPYSTGYEIFPLDSSGVIAPVVNPITAIDSLKMNDANGLPLMVGDTINTTGIVTSLKQLGTGTSGPGTIQNGNTAISVYGTVFTQATGIQIGDSVVINNFKVTNYNGLNELSSIASSTVQIISSGHVVNPTIITIPQISQGWNGFEKYEGMLVKLNNVAFSDTGSGYDTFNLHTSTSGWNYHVANGTDTVIFRLTKTNTSLIGKSVPTGPISVVGIVQQYVTSAPYSTGYEIFPLDSSGVISSLANTITAIDSLKENGTTGIPLMVGDTISTTGIVTSILQLGTGTAGPGTIQNANTGISVYGTAFTQTSGLQLGDSVVIKNWKVTNYNGLNELASTANSSVQIISSGHTVNPTVITIPQISQGWNGFEKYEGMLVKLNNVAFSDTGSGYDTFNLHTSTSGWNYHVANGTDTVIFRLTKTNTSLLGKSVPTGPISIVGVVQQYVTSAPYSTGYEIFPLDSSGVVTPLKNPIIAIDSLKMNDANGVSLMANDTINTTGIVTSILQTGTGTAGPASIQNANTGVFVYGTAFTQISGLQVGDSVVIKNWKVSPYNGLTELASTANSSVEIVSSGHKINPVVITIPQISQGWNGFEKYEGMYVQLNNVKFADTASEFRLSSGTYGRSYIVNNNDTVQFFFTKNCASLVGKSIPKGLVNIRGIVDQYTSTSPASGGYEIVPLDSSSVIAYPITILDSLKVNGSTGVPLMANDTINTTGIVTSILQVGTGTAGPATIQNANTGICVYGTAFTQTANLQVGDSVVIYNWKVSPYNGLTELASTANSSVQIISSGHKVDPLIATIPQIFQGWNGFEKYEGMYVQINNVTFEDTASEFRLSGGTYGRSYIVNDKDTIEFFFTQNCTSLVGKSMPKVPVNVRGIIDQYTSSTPASGGYELVPLDSSAIQIIEATDSKQAVVYTYNLFQNYPNPFNPSTIIRFSVPSSEKVELTVYDILGRKVVTLFNSIAPAGITNVNFNAQNLASGVYIYTIRTKGATFSKKLMLLK